MAVETPAPSAAGEAGGGIGGFLKRHRRVAGTVLGAAVIFGLFYYVVPQFAGLGPTLRRLRAGNLWWLGLGVLVEAASIGGDIVLLRGVFATPGSRIGWKASYQITLAGAAATKLFATAGAGGVALTVWALRASGLSEDKVATGLVCFEILEYGVYMAALAIVGLGLWFGVFAGRAPVGVTLVPALFGLVVILIVLSMLVVEAPVERFLTARGDRSTGRRQRRWRRVAAVPHSLRSGLTAAIVMVRRRDPSLLGALAGWGFDIAALWASFRAFGHAPPPAVLVMGYYVGTLGNALPLPGGIGGVEGGMIGAFLAFGVNGPLTVLAVLAYRTISYWLPTVPGAIAYIRLRGTVSGWRSQPAGPAGSPPPVAPLRAQSRALLDLPSRTHDRAS
ncbi:MAG: lysylphosphatidylglycerol synthase transmembrane domain-containing protein [Solirubrobacteraceae bacterium]